MGAVLRVCPTRQPASRARVASSLNEPRSPSAVMRQVLFEEEDSQAVVVPSGDESTGEADRSSTSSSCRNFKVDSGPEKPCKVRRRRGEALEDTLDAWHCAQSMGEVVRCLSNASASVTKLALKGLPLTDEEVSQLGRLLSDNVQVSRLALNECNLGDQAAEYLAEALMENEVLTSLSLEGNRVGDRGAARLASALEKNEALTSLSLGRNCLGAVGVKSLLDALEHNYTLLTLDLASNSQSRPSWSSAGDSRASIQKRLQALLKRNRGPRKVVTLQAALNSEAGETNQGSPRNELAMEMLHISCTSVAGNVLSELVLDGTLGVRQLREELAERLEVPKPHLALLLTDGSLLEVHDQRSLIDIFLPEGMQK